MALLTLPQDRFQTHSSSEIKKEIETRYGIIIGKPVILHLNGEDHRLRGTLTIISKALPETRPKLLLQLGKRQFTLAQIDSIARL